MPHHAPLTKSYIQTPHLLINLDLKMHRTPIEKIVTTMLVFKTTKVVCII
jgi:hypothetical protein